VRLRQTVYEINTRSALYQLKVYKQWKISGSLTAQQRIVTSIQVRYVDTDQTEVCSITKSIGSDRNRA
jgi:hypothetical protein